MSRIYLSPVLVLLEQDHSPLFTFGLWLLSCYNAQGGRFDRGHMACKAENISISGPFRKSLVNTADSSQVFI